MEIKQIFIVRTLTKYINITICLLSINKNNKLQYVILYTISNVLCIKYNYTIFKFYIDLIISHLVISLIHCVVY